jgi:hypothetical protein
MGAGVAGTVRLTVLVGLSVEGSMVVVVVVLAAVVGDVVDVAVVGRGRCCWHACFCLQLSSDLDGPWCCASSEACLLGGLPILRNWL